VSFDFSTLITDRTQSDIQYVQRLAEKIKSGTATEDEVYEFAHVPLKGTYNVEDVQRVVVATKFLVDRLIGFGYNVEYVDAGIAYTVETIPTKSQMERYLQNIENVKKAIDVSTKMPQTMDNLTIDGANNIEKTLIVIQDTIERIILSFGRSNGFAFWSGIRPLPSS
jgi:hypothetical protein